MKKWYEENYVSRRDWILDNLNRLPVTSEQALILLMIDFDNQHGRSISLDTLCQQTGLSIQQVDKAVSDLNKKGYLKITTKSRRIVFDISGIFEWEEEKSVSQDVFQIFETEFGRVLSQMETTAIADWLSEYGEETVLDALREASIQKKVDVRYINRILSNWSKNGR
ncbi:MAG: DnaD domain protein [Erysipelotrichaceae bacterium]|nr:DnaD domain protein [Erysipelotrichaceae bacterium]